MPATFKVGDRVHVVSTPPANRSIDPVWIAEMDTYCGKTGTVFKDSDPRWVGVTFEDGNSYYFLSEWLEPASPAVTFTSSLPDSGRRIEYSTGARRDIQEGKGRYDLLPPAAIHAYARRLEEGAKKYSEHNWRKGIPLSRFLSSAARHLFQLIEGDTSEDHAGAVLFNVGGFIQTLKDIQDGKLPKELDDRFVRPADPVRPE